MGRRLAGPDPHRPRPRFSSRRADGSPPARTGGVSGQVRPLLGALNIRAKGFSWSRGRRGALMGPVRRIAQPQAFRGGKQGDPAVTPVIGAVLILAITILGIGGVLMWGAP